MSAGWGWQNNPLTTSASFKCSHLYQLTMNEGSAKWADEDRRTVKIDWDYMLPTQSNSWDGTFRFDRLFVYDERAEMRLVVNMYREDGKFIDSQEYILSKDEIMAKTKTIAMPCCVAADWRMPAFAAISS